MLSGEGEMTYRASLKPDDLAYRTIVPYAEWMNGASLLLDRKDYGLSLIHISEPTRPY